MENEEIEITFRPMPNSQDYKSNAIQQYNFRMDTRKWCLEASALITEYEVKEMKEFLNIKK